MKTYLFAFITVLSFILLNGTVALADQAPSSLQQHVKFLSESPRHVNSEGHEIARQYLKDQLSQLGIVPQVDSQIHEGVFWGDHYIYPLRNIHGLLPGTGELEGRVVLVAHYDTVPGSPGAADNAAGVAVLLSMAEALVTVENRKRDILILFTDGEELSAGGASQAVKDGLIQSDDIVINLDARGVSGSIYLFETTSRDEGLLRQFEGMLPSLKGASLLGEIIEYLPNYTDFKILKTKAKYGYNLAFGDGYIHYHSKNDTFENLDKQTLSELYSSVSLLTKNLLSTDLAELESGGAAQFITIPFLGIVVLSEMTMIILVILAFLLMVYSIYHFERDRSLIKQTLVALPALLLLLAVNSAALFYVSYLFEVSDYSLLHYKDKSFFATLAVAIVAFNLLTTKVLFKMNKKAFHIIAFTFSLILWGVTQIVIPGGSYLFGLSVLAVLPLSLSSYYAKSTASKYGLYLVSFIAIALTWFDTIEIFYIMAEQQSLVFIALISFLSLTYFHLFIPRFRMNSALLLVFFIGSTAFLSSKVTVPKRGLFGKQMEILYAGNEKNSYLSSHESPKNFCLEKNELVDTSFIESGSYYNSNFEVAVTPIKQSFEKPLISKVQKEGKEISFEIEGINNSTMNYLQILSEDRIENLEILNQQVDLKENLFKGPVQWSSIIGGVNKQAIPVSIKWDEQPSNDLRFRVISVAEAQERSCKNEKITYSIRSSKEFNL